MLENKILSIASWHHWSFHQRLWMYQKLGLMAEFAFISSGCEFTNSDLSNISIGNQVFLNRNCYLENSLGIIIGDNTCLGPFVKILNTTHEIGSHVRRTGNDCVRKSVMIGSGCWIGANSLILPGVMIGNGCVIAAGSVVTQNCDENQLYAGVPARRKKNLKVEGSTFHQG